MGYRNATRQAHAQTLKAASSGSEVKISDYAGIAVLAALEVVFVTVDLSHNHMDESFIGYICRVLDLPVGFAENGWDLRTTIGLAENISPSSEAGTPYRQT